MGRGGACAYNLSAREVETGRSLGEVDGAHGNNTPGCPLAPTCTCSGRYTKVCTKIFRGGKSHLEGAHFGQYHFQLAPIDEMSLLN